MSDVIYPIDLEVAKKHDTFHSEVITGKAGGVAGGADIETATNAVTGQVQMTLPETLNRISPYYFGDFPDVGDPSVTLTNATQCLVWQIADGGDGHHYAWDGVFPKLVAAGSTPTPLGAGGWVDRSDVNLRAELQAGGSTIAEIASLKTDLAETGSDISIAGKTAAAVKTDTDMLLHPIKSIPSYSAVNATQAWKDSVSLYGYVYFQGFSASETVYNIIGDDAALHGTTVYVDDNVNLTFDYDYYQLIGSLKIKGNCKFSFSAKSFSTKGGEVNYVRKSANINRFPLKASVVSFSDCTHQTVNSDTFTSGSFGSSSASAILVPLSTGLTTGLFAPINIGETITAHVKVSSGSVASIGLLLRCGNGWIKLHRAQNNPGAWTYQVKQVGQAVVTGNSIPAPSNTLNSYSPGNASFGISLTSRNAFRLIINGVSGYFPIGSGVGDIYEVGFICDGATAGSVSRVTGLCCYKTDDNKAHGAAPVHLAIYGDSTAEKWLSSLDMYLPQVIDGATSTRSLSINNFAVAGETFAKQFARLQANGPGQASIICMIAGTNEGQAGTSADTFATQVQQFIDYCNTNGRTPMLVEPWMWYAKSFIGGAGQTSSNYDGVSELREAGKRVALSGGAIYVSTTHELPAPLPEYFGTSLDPLLRDDIHQSELGYRLYAELIGSHIVEYLSRVTTNGRYVPFYWANSAVVASISAESKITGSGLSASVNVSAFSNGAVILRLPRGCRPDRPTVFTGSYLLSGGTYGVCKLSYANGQITADGLTQVTSTIYMDANW